MTADNEAVQNASIVFDNDLVLNNYGAFITDVGTWFFKPRVTIPGEIQ